MMSFEDIVDMDWLDSHSIKGEPMDLFPNDYVDFNHYLSTDLLSPKLEASSPPPLLLQSPTSSVVNPVSATSCSAAAALAAATTTPPPPLTFPTTEQIKQLIELAKHQLALRAQANTNMNNASTTSTNSSSATGNPASTNKAANATTNNNNGDNNNDTTTASSSSATTLSPPSALNDTDTASSTHLAHLANATLFGSSSNSLPDTVSPESLMKPAISTTPSTIAAALTGHSLSSESTAMAMEEEKATVKKSSLSTASASSPSSSSASISSLARRDSLVDEVGSLEAYAESDGIDIKKLTPKERRQLRNKISARNFRVRRKEYITTLEQQVNDHKKHAESLVEQLGKVENENKQLRQEVDTLKRQNLLLQQQQHLQAQVC